jgi:hypothetical protein
MDYRPIKEMVSFTEGFCLLQFTAQNTSVVLCETPDSRLGDSVAFIELISHLSNSTMRMLRLPASFSLPSISLGVDTSQYHLFLTQNKVVILTLNAWIVYCSVNPKTTDIRSETLGSPVFPYYPCLPLICSQTPVESPPLVRLRRLDVALAFRTTKASTLRTVSRFNSIPSAVARASAERRSLLCLARNVRCARLRFVPSSLMTTQDSLPLVD